MPWYRIDETPTKAIIVHMRLARNRTPRNCPWPALATDDQQPFGGACGRMVDYECDVCDKPMCSRHRRVVQPVDNDPIDICPNHPEYTPVDLLDQA
jgi:hypothetical protein